MSFYDAFFKAVDSATASYITDKAAAVVGSISGVATTMLVIYVAFFVIAIAMGHVKEPMFDFAMRLIKVSLILGIGLNVGLYMKFFGNFLSQAPDQMAAVLTPGVSASTVGSVLDAVVDSCYERFLAAWHKAGIFDGDFGMYLIALSYAAVMVVGTLYAAFLMVLSKIALSLLLALGPIFVVCLMFKSTQRFFEAWFCQAVNYGMVLVLTVACLSLITTMLSTAIKHSPTGADVGFWDAACLVTVAGLGMLVMAQIPSLAAGLGGGLALSTLGFAERVSGGLYRNTWQRQPYSSRDSNGNPTTVYRRPVVHRTGQAVSGTYFVAKNLYRRATGMDRNAVSKQ